MHRLYYKKLGYVYRPPVDPENPKGRLCLIIMTEVSSNRARFASLEGADLKTLVEDCVPKGTKRATDQWIRTFK